jgi:predicted HTH transcriptional regulator
MYIFLFMLLVGLSFGAGVQYGRTSRSRAPELFIEDDEVDDPRVAAARQAVRARTERRLAKILAQAQVDGRITNDGAEELFCISDRTASVYLSELTKRGDLERKGAGRGTFYTPTEA